MLVKTKKEYEWELKDLDNVEKNGKKVFSCFACGGGSTMGYKLAGYEVLGCNEIDPKLIATYIENHHPKYAFCEPIQTFKLRDNLPEELFYLDILDGSPPCSNFSMAGNREKDWGKEKKFREGQANQVLDTLFFDFIDLAKKLQPKVVVSENVKGLLLGGASKYVTRIYKEFDEAGYYTKHFLLNAKRMGVPQSRERVFFVSIRKDLADRIGFEDLFCTVPRLELDFKEKEIPFIDCELEDSTNGKQMYPGMLPYYAKCKPGNNMSTVSPKGSNYWFNYIKIDPNKPCPTLASANNDKLFHYERPEQLSLKQWAVCDSFPLDYNFMEDGTTKNDGRYIIGMSVPPLMIKKISEQIYKQWLVKL